MPVEENGGQPSVSVKQLALSNRPGWQGDIRQKRRRRRRGRAGPLRELCSKGKWPARWRKLPARSHRDMAYAERWTSHGFGSPVGRRNVRIRRSKKGEQYCEPERHFIVSVCCCCKRGHDIGTLCDCGLLISALHAMLCNYRLTGLQAAAPCWSARINLECLVETLSQDGGDPGIWVHAVLISCGRCSRMRYVEASTRDILAKQRHGLTVEAQTHLRGSWGSASAPVPLRRELLVGATGWTGEL